MRCCLMSNQVVSMVTTVFYGDNKQADLCLRNKHIRFQTCAALQMGFGCGGVTGGLGSILHCLVVEHCAETSGNDHHPTS